MSNNPTFALNNLFNVEGWTAVITGGGTGIGLMAAQALANNGARVYITSRRQDTLAQTVKVHGSSLVHPRGEIIALPLDVTSKQSIADLVQEISTREKHVDLLINSAGISKGSSEVEKGDESPQELSKELGSESVEDWEDVYRTNVIGAFFTTVAFIPLLSAATQSTHGHSGSVINIASISGITNTTQHHFKYNVSKAATIQLNSLLAQELRRKETKIRVNAISPGIFPSEMTTKESNDQNKSHIPAGEKYRDEKGIPAGRPGRDEDMAQAVLMLATNQYMSGQNVVVDGGYLLEHP
ncbi:NAD(P)-binding protein [Sistotremastrum niveocremeum HHB9708]|uniref:NAD(P)-binding protein n=2 Tax=Sistotremastraceae TaxID=3402574 RepID=A0A164XCQ0_9AGAM|nr:NAD(P)-binding protein [Sistotremastrum niveocremeum HHB9708]KZT36588.1 NAD(P)-binding protein [Sistotremastrum suecicum HHB10207 ss-3]